MVALTALTFLVLYNAVSVRLGDRTDACGQIADLSRAPPIWRGRSPNSAAGWPSSNSRVANGSSPQAQNNFKR